MEQWKDIKGYEGLYKISNLGRVKSFVSKKPKIIKGTDNGLGYLRVSLNKKRYYIHRLVATVFINNQQEKSCVNHIDCNTKNNTISNLEWCTKQENTNHMIKLKRNERTKEWINKLHNSQKKHYKKIVGTNIKTKEKLIFNSINETKKYGFNPSDICNCCKGLRKKAKGYTWNYL